MHSIIVAPSVLASNFGCLHKEIRRAEKAGADWHHLDIMDGHFVDNISFGPAFCEAVAEVATKPLDVHLMIEHPDHYFRRFAEFAHNITIHVEAKCNVKATLKAIRAAGCNCGITLKPNTRFEAVEPYLAQVNLVLVMTVEPGFGGQNFRVDMMEKVQAAAALRQQRKLNYRIEVDGGIDVQTAVTAKKAGADTLVVGTASYQARKRGMSMATAILKIRGS